jgi:hypothetical protein
MRLSPTVGFALMLMLVACQPALNWRDARPAGSGAVALFPCKPDVEERPARVDTGAMGLATCEVSALRLALSWADLADPAQARAALTAMPQALATKVGQRLPPAKPLQVPGMTPMTEAAQYRLAGPAGVTRVAVFAYGARVYQAVMTAGADETAAWDAFVGGLRVGAAAGPAR